MCPHLYMCVCMLNLVVVGGASPQSIIFSGLFHLPPSSSFPPKASLRPPPTNAPSPNVCLNLMKCLFSGWEWGGEICGGEGLGLWWKGDGWRCKWSKVVVARKMTGGSGLCVSLSYFFPFPFPFNFSFILFFKSN